MVNALNFCSFAMCSQPLSAEQNDPEELLVATPGLQDGYINVTSFPSEQRLATIPTPKAVQTGMVMAVGLLVLEDCLTVLAGYESGHVSIWQKDASTKFWQAIYTNKAHNQPVLSLDASTAQLCFFTSSADAIIARHSFSTDVSDPKLIQTKHAGQQSLNVRSDERIFATAGWDGRVRVYSTKTMDELAVLKWHKEGCYALAFADVNAGAVSNKSEMNEQKDNSADSRLTVSEMRTSKAKSTHWLVAGSKDGKISLWDIY